VNITKTEVLHICKLAKLKLSEEELCRTTAELEEIIQHMKCIEKFSFEEKEITKANVKTALSDGKIICQKENITQIDVKTQVLRKDEVKPFSDYEKLFRNTRDMKDGYIRVPKIIE